MASRKLIVEIVGDSTSLERAFNRSTASAKKFESSLGGPIGKSEKLNQALRGGLSGFGGKTGFLFGSGAFVGSAVAVAALQASISAASDLNEQITKSQQVFGDSSKAILDWSQTTAKAIGTSQEQALEAAGTFGNLFKSIHLGDEQSADTSRRLVQLAADLASFNNTSPADALEAIRSGLVGEAEPLRRYGVLLSEARVQQLALQQTGKATVKQLTDQDKALARVAIIFRDTTTAQGDFARTSTGLANQQRILSAEVKDLEANMGRLLLPGVVKLTQALVDATDIALKLTDGLNALSHVKIPAIHIPFVLDVGGGGELGDFFKDALLGAAENLPSVGPLVRGLEIAAAAKVGEAAESETPKLAAQFETTLNSFFTNALSQAAQKAKPDESKIKGFGTGLTPTDLFGTLITELPNRLKEALLDAQIDTPNLLKDNIDVLKRQKAALERAIEDPRLTVKQRVDLKSQLKSVLDQIDGLNAQIAQAVDDAANKRTKAAEDAANKAEKARQQQRDAFDKLTSALQLGVDQAVANENFAKALAFEQRLQAAIENQIKLEGKTPELLRQLFETRQQEASLISQQAQRKQFTALGLSPAGEAKVPGVENLKKQLRSLTENIAGTTVDTPKTRSQLARIADVLSGAFGKATEETRAKIKELFQAIRDEFDQESNKPLTKTTSLNTNKILSGLGLGADQVRELRSRLSAFNSAGAALAGAPAGTVGAFGMLVPAQPTTVNTTIELDGRVVAKSTTKHQQTRSRRNPPQKRGPHGI